MKRINVLEFKIILAQMENRECSGKEIYNWIYNVRTYYGITTKELENFKKYYLGGE